MGKFLRNFGMGLVYIFLSPILLCLLALASICCLGAWFYYVVTFVIRFFRGQNGFIELKEDALLRQKIEAEKEEALGIKEKEEKVAAAPQQVFVQQNFYQMPPGYVPPPVNGNNSSSAVPPLVDLSEAKQLPPQTEIPSLPLEESSLKEEKEAEEIHLDQEEIDE